MQIDPSRHSKADNYKLLSNLIVPRPIAWVSSLGENGLVNLAPFSFFNAISAAPMYVMFSVMQNESGAPKDTERNVRARKEFVINLVTEELFEAMNLSAADFPLNISEVDAAGLRVVPSFKIVTPRIAEAKASLECRLHSEQRLGDYTMFIGEVVMFHVADELIGPRLRINGFAPLGRMGSPSVYCRTTDSFDVARISYAQWLEKMGKTSHDE